MSPTFSPTLTLTEFLQQPETKPAREFIAGEIQQKPMPKGRHSCLQYELCRAINQVAKPAKLAYAFPELRCTFGDIAPQGQAQRSLVPDIAVFLWPHIAFLSNGTVPDRFDHPPDWAIEILSPEQSSTKVIRNLLDCIAAGSQLGWLLNPDDATLLVFWPDRPPIFLDQQAPVPTLPEIPLNLTVADVFSWLAIA